MAEHVTRLPDFPHLLRPPRHTWSRPTNPYKLGDSNFMQPCLRTSGQVIATVVLAQSLQKTLNEGKGMSLRNQVRTAGALPHIPIFSLSARDLSLTKIIENIAGEVVNNPISHKDAFLVFPDADCSSLRIALDGKGAGNKIGTHRLTFAMANGWLPDPDAGQIVRHLNAIGVNTQGYAIDINPHNLAVGTAADNRRDEAYRLSARNLHADWADYPYKHQDMYTGRMIPCFNKSDTVPCTCPVRCTWSQPWDRLHREGRRIEQGESFNMPKYVPSQYVEAFLTRKKWTSHALKAHKTSAIYYFTFDANYEVRILRLPVGNDKNFHSFSMQEEEDHLLALPALSADSDLLQPLVQ